MTTRSAFNRIPSRVLTGLSALHLGLLAIGLHAQPKPARMEAGRPAARESDFRFEISIPPNVPNETVTGRILVVISRTMT